MYRYKYELTTISFAPEIMRKRNPLVVLVDAYMRVELGQILKQSHRRKERQSETHANSKPEEIHALYTANWSTCYHVKRMSRFTCIELLVSRLRHCRIAVLLELSVPITSTNTLRPHFIGGVSGHILFADLGIGGKLAVIQNRER